MPSGPGAGVSSGSESPDAALIRLVDRVKALADREDEGAPGLPRVETVDTPRGSRESLLLAPMGEVSLSVRVPSTHPRFVCFLSLIGEKQISDLGVSFSFRAGDQEVRALASVSSSGGEWQRFEVALDRVAGATGTFRIAVAPGPATARVSVGEPCLTGVSSDDRPDVILVSLDTVRADYLSCFGHPYETTPALDALALESVVFSQVIAPAPWTLPSQVSLFSGQYPDRHGVVKRDSEVSPASVLLAEEFRAAGYRTFAWTGGGYVNPHFGLGRGFERYLVDDAASPPPGHPTGMNQDGELTDEGRWSKQARASLMAELGSARHGPRFLFIHTYAAHEYEAEESVFRELGAPEDLLPELMAGVYGKSRADNPFFREDLSDEEKVHLREIGEWMYRAALRNADLLLGEVIDALRSAGRLDDTILVVTSDHGEELFEHGGFGHGRSLYEESIRVPLFVRVAGFDPRSIEDVASLVDVAPTIRELAGLRVRPRIQASQDGRSLVPLLRGEGMDVRPVMAHNGRSSESRALRGRTLKLIKDVEGDHLFDLEDDPGERAELLGDRQDSKKRLAKLLRAMVKELHRTKVRVSDAGGLPPDLRRQLEELGYLGGD